MTDDYTSAHRLDVEHLRNLLVQVSIVAFGSVGFSIPIIGASASLRSPIFLIIGLTLLLITAVGGLWYSAIIIENSIKKSREGYKENKEEVDEAISNQVFLMKHPDKYSEYVEKVQRFSDKLSSKAKNIPDIKHDKVLYLLLSFLTIGIVFIFLSLLPIDGTQKNTHRIPHGVRHFRPY